MDTGRDQTKGWSWIAAAAILLTAMVVGAQGPAAAAGSPMPLEPAAPAAGGIDEDPVQWEVIPTSCDNEADDGQEREWSIPVDLSWALDKDVNVHYATADGTATAGEDYRAVTNGTVTIPAGKTRGAAKVWIRTNHLSGNEFFFVRIFDPSVGTITVARARVTIVMR